MTANKATAVLAIVMSALLVGIATAVVLRSSKPATDDRESRSAALHNDVADASLNELDAEETEKQPEADSKEKDTATKPGSTSRETATSNDTPADARPPAKQPSPPPPITAISPSGQAVPRTSFGVWKHIFYDDFTKAAAVGSWGEHWDQNRIVYTGAQGQQWRAYPQSFLDTYDRRPYRSDQVLSVKDGILNFHLHQVDGQPAGANPSPVISGGSQYQTFGRYSARFKVDSPDLHEYYVAWLLWPESEAWPDDGEINFPEGTLSETASGFIHYADEGSHGPCRPHCQRDVYTTARFTDWHTYTIEWLPNRVRFILDGEVIVDSTDYIPNKPMRWQLQTETKGEGSNSGNLMVDWVSVWQYSP